MANFVFSLLSLFFLLNLFSTRSCPPVHSGSKESEFPGKSLLSSFRELAETGDLASSSSSLPPSLLALFTSLKKDAAEGKVLSATERNALVAEEYRKSRLDKSSSPKPKNWAHMMGGLGLHMAGTASGFDSPLEDSFLELLKQAIARDLEKISANASKGEEKYEKMQIKSEEGISTASIDSCAAKPLDFLFESIDEKEANVCALENDKVENDKVENPSFLPPIQTAEENELIVDDPPRPPVAIVDVPEAKKPSASKPEAPVVVQKTPHYSIISEPKLDLRVPQLPSKEFELFHSLAGSEVQKTTSSSMRAEASVKSMHSKAKADLEKSANKSSKTSIPTISTKTTHLNDDQSLQKALRDLYELTTKNGRVPKKLRSNMPKVTLYDSKDEVPGKPGKSPIAALSSKSSLKSSLVQPSSSIEKQET